MPSYSYDNSLSYPILPLRDTIILPSCSHALFVGESPSVRAIEVAKGSHSTVVFVHQDVGTPVVSDATSAPSGEQGGGHMGGEEGFKSAEFKSAGFKTVGTLCQIQQAFFRPEGIVKILVRGIARVAFFDLEPTAEGYLEGKTQVIETLHPEAELVETVEFVRLQKAIQQYLIYEQSLNNELKELFLNPGNEDTIDILANFLLNDTTVLYEFLSSRELTYRMERLSETIELKNTSIELENTIRHFHNGKDNASRGFSDLSFGEEEPHDENEIEELKRRLERDTKLTEAAKERVSNELKKLSKMNLMSAEATVSRNYIEWIFDLPWNTYTEEQIDLQKAKQTLADDHYGLEKPKERILEQLAVQSLTSSPSGTILCFLGPPGVGKTSLGRSIAEATNRKFVRISLGGIQDQAEIRGHRRTYIGAMPGKVIQALKRAGSSNPVILLDEIDKMARDHRGDPAAAMLEVLDPEQNKAFNDHYLDLDYDLSQVMFICTANDITTLPGPLRDRMELIELMGYTSQEKVEIAREHLLNKLKRQNGIEDLPFTLTDEAIMTMANVYTKEAGVRNLERELGTLCRKIAYNYVLSQSKTPKDLSPEINQAIGVDDLKGYLGTPKYRERTLETYNQVGITNGLAWTQVGGVLLVSEALALPGKGELIITGKLGEVMQESARAALSYVRSRASALGLESDFHKKLDIHVHFPEGATPKDGPSAGITMTVSLVSALSQIPVKHDIAMTGEVTLRGRVLAIGGLKEKVMAAHRAGIRTVLIPKANALDIEEIPAEVLSEVTIELVDHVDDVLIYALDLEDPDQFKKQLNEFQHRSVQ